MVAHLLTGIRMSMADFNFDESAYLDGYQNVAFWILWVLITILSCMIFLNFIIAEVSETYNRVKSTLQVVILQERGQMINESQDVLRARFGADISKWNHLFPKYLITREVDN